MSIINWYKRVLRIFETLRILNKTKIFFDYYFCFGNQIENRTNKLSYDIFINLQGIELSSRKLMNSNYLPRFQQLNYIYIIKLYTIYYIVMTS